MKNIVFHNLYESLKNTENVDFIENEFYIYESSKIQHENSVRPLKTDCAIICICLEGELKGKIDLKDYHIKASGLAISQPGQILEHSSYSHDFKGIIIFMTQHFTEDISLLSGRPMSMLVKEHPYITLSKGELKSILNYCDMVKKVIRTDNPNRLQIIKHLTIAYYYGLGYYLHSYDKPTECSNNEILTDKFLQKVRQNYKSQRKVEFYATELKLSPNYLSHVVKSVTNKTAGEWIDDYVALEAKALLKSTNMTIQQIADELNFTTQTFFGKFFKRVVGVAPKFYK